MVRTRSLFWTFAGVFLAVLAVATVLQVGVSVGVLGPLQMQSTRDRAELALARASQQLAALPDIFDNREVARVLRANRVEGASVLLVYRGSDGHLVTERSVQPAIDHQIGVLLGASASVGPIAAPESTGSGLAGRANRSEAGLEVARPRRPAGSPRAVEPEGDRPPPPPPGGPGPPPRDDELRPPPPRPGDQPPPPEEDGAPGVKPPPPPEGPGPPTRGEERRPPPDRSEPAPRDSTRRPPRARDAEPSASQESRGRSPEPEGLRVEPRDLELELIARRPVTSVAGMLGEVAALSTAPHRTPWSLPEARAQLLFLPFAVLAAGGAGLLMVRILVRRLRALELLAVRVTDGDLAARVVDPRPDEIGRLGERFNRMTERLAAARAQLEATDQQRRRLLADITHELATPLTSIRGYVETLLDPAVPTSPEERSTYLNDVLEEAKRLELLIGDLFDLARLEAGTNPLTLRQLDWMALCLNTMRRFEPRFREAGLDLQWTGPAAESWVNADGRRLEQAVDNLLVNALRYVPAGGSVRLAMERVAAREGDRFRLTVSDDGPGIAPGDLPHIFERFYRAAAVRSSSGSGLGLAIVQEIVRRHGGEVRVESPEPRGTAFIVELPALSV